MFCFCSLAVVHLSSTSTPTPGPGLAIQGKVHGGNQPITGAHVYLFAANNTGNAGPGLPVGPTNKSTSLLTTGSSDTVGDYVTTDSNGNFSITSSEYSCTPDVTQVYLYALGGNPGLIAGTNNLSAGLLAVLGNCPSAGNFLTATPFIDVNEVSTIAAAYALAGYATDATHVSSSGSALATVGIKNAFANAANLETLSTGVALAATPTAPTSSTVPQSEINTLADILAACINTTGDVTGGMTPTPCYTLFTNALAGGTTGAQPSDTATAAINIAHNPSANIAALYGLAAASPPFPGLGTQPNDFTIALSFTGGGILDSMGDGNSPNAIAIDASGNVWTANQLSNSVSELASSGQPLSGANGYQGGSISSPYGLAIDNNIPANVWVTNSATNSVTELNSSGTASMGSPYSAGSMNKPLGIAIDGTGNLWIANNGANSVTELTSAGANHSGSPYSGGGLSKPYGIAVDTAGNAWAANNNATVGTTVTQITSTGPVSVSGGGLDGPVGVAIDSSNDAWIANAGSSTSSVVEFSSTDSLLSGPSGYTGGGVSAGGAGLLAIDGSGNVWIANIVSGSVSELSSSGGAISGTNGYTSDALNDNPIGVAIDPSGNVWVSCLDRVVELVGAGTPAVTPLSTAVANSKLGQRP